MPTNRWLGDYTATARVGTLTVGGTVANGDKVSYTIGGVKVEVTAVVPFDTAALLAEKLYNALVASQDPRFKEIVFTYTSGNTFVTLTAATPGVPWTGTTGSTGTTTLTWNQTVASTGPNHVDEPKNYSTGALPQAGEDLLIDQGAEGLWGFETLTAVALASFRVKASFANKKWGLPFRNANDYVEYRTRAHPLATAIPAQIGEGDGDGPTLVNLSVTTAVDLTVHKTGSRIDSSAPVVNVKGCSSGTINVSSGDVGLASDDDTTSGTVTTLNLTEEATFTVGKAGTVTTANQDGGTLMGYGTVTTLNITAGEATLTVAPTTIVADGGKVWKRFTGTVTTATFRPGVDAQSVPSLDCSLDPRPFTITNASFTGGAYINDPDNTSTWTNFFTMDMQSVKNSNFGNQQFTLRRV